MGPCDTVTSATMCGAAQQQAVGLYPVIGAGTLCTGRLQSSGIGNSNSGRSSPQEFVSNTWMRISALRGQPDRQLQCWFLRRRLSPKLHLHLWMFLPGCQDSTKTLSSQPTPLNSSLGQCKRTRNFVNCRYDEHFLPHCAA